MELKYQEEIVFIQLRQLPHGPVKLAEIIHQQEIIPLYIHLEVNHLAHHSGEPMLQIKKILENSHNMANLDNQMC